MTDSVEQDALQYHKYSTPGKLAIQATKPLSNQRDLALAYSPGVAFGCTEIEKDSCTAADYTARANLVGVVSKGKAVLGLGSIGPLAGKPVMEGKAVLFKKFANIDVFDIEIEERVRVGYAGHDPKAYVPVWLGSILGGTSTWKYRFRISAALRPE